MGNGYSPVGQVPAMVFNDTGAEIYGDTRLDVSTWWTSGDCGVQIHSPAAEALIVLDEDEAFHLVRLLLRAVQPAKRERNGFEAWSHRVMEVADEAIRLAGEHDADVDLVFERRTTTVPANTDEAPF